MSAAWSVQHSLTSRLTGVMLLLVVTMTGLSVWFLGESASRRLAELSSEEIAEIRTAFSDAVPTREEFVRITVDLGAYHPGIRLAWRVWNADGSLLHEAGPRPLLDRAPHSPGPDAVRLLAPGLFWRTAPLDAQRIVGILVDGTGELEIVREHQILIAGAGAALAVLALLTGVLFARHVSALLRRVADSARAGASLVPDVGADSDAPEEIREVAEALADMRRSIRAGIERQNLLVAGLAHELRSPIQNIQGEAEVALLRKRAALEYRAVLESQVEELRDLARAVDNLVSLCSPAAPQAASDLEDFDLGHEAQLRLDREVSAAARRDVRLRIAAKGELGFRGDREAILLALRNVVGNAVAWSPPGGAVDVTIEGCDGYVEVTVDDGGPGVPAAERDRIFQPFYRGRTSPGSRSGYGLGLSLTRSAVEAHGGSIVVGDSPAGGARFRLRLPRRAGVAPAGITGA